MIPTNDEFLSASCTWRGEHHQVRYELSWHGRSEYQPQGIWCWYLLLTEEQFYPDDWKRLRLERQDRQFGDGGSWHRHWDYDSFPDVEPHGGWTFGEMHIQLGRDGKEYEHVKVGCDYNHSWDRDGYYSEGRAEIESDVKRSIDRLVAMFPKRRERCGYSGKWDDSDQFYTARNGSRIHKSNEAKLRADKWDCWWPADETAAA
jgi:hypothetical protein